MPGLMRLAPHTSIRPLVLEVTEIFDTGVHHLRDLINLEEINLSTTEISSKSYLLLKQFTKLRSLNFDHGVAGASQLDDESIRHVAELPLSGL